MRRFTIRSTFVVIMLLMAALVAIPAASANELDSEALDARDWLISQQLDDGSFPGFDGEGDPGATTDAIVAMVAAGDADDEIEAARDYLDDVADEYSATQGGAAKLLLAYSAAGVDGSDIVDLIVDREIEDSVYDEQIFIHATAILALASAGETIPDPAVDFLLETQIEDGSWAFTGDTDLGMGDTNTTAMVIQALIQAGIENSEVIDSAIDYLESAQLDDGSFVYAIDAEDPPLGDSNSTALSIQAMIAVGVDEDDERIVAAHEALRGFQNESGALGYREDMPDDNALSTAQGLPAMLNNPLPVVAGDEEAVEQVETEADDEASEDIAVGDTCDHFDVTGESICHGFGDYWWANGGLAIFGYPLTGEFDGSDADGNDVVVQHFERAKFVYDGDQVWHEAIGYDAIDILPQTEILDPVGPCDQPDGADYAVCGAFLTYWNEFGGAEILGMPITDQFGSDGMAIQVFEYARFEYHPDEWPERHDVLLGRIGAEVLEHGEE